MDQTHQWRKATEGFGRRFAFGMLLALSLALVAFEWRTPKGEHTDVGTPYLVNEFLDEPILVRIKKEAEKQAVAPEKPKPKPAAGPVKAVEPEINVEPSIVPIEPAMTDPGPPETLARTEPTNTESTGTAIRVPPPTLNPEIRPHFIDCLRGDMKKTDLCTEQRIQRHLERQMNIPRSMIGVVATTVTFEINAQGRIGMLHCAPKVSEDVEREIARVIRSLPEFRPGTQVGHPVPVYYQIPLRLRNH